MLLDGFSLELEENKEKVVKKRISEEDNQWSKEEKQEG